MWRMCLNEYPLILFVVANCFDGILNVVIPIAFKFRLCCHGDQLYKYYS